MITTAMSGVEITDVQATHVSDGNETFVRLYTNEGVTGTGEAYWGPGIRDIIQDARGTLLGEDPRDTDRLCRKLFEGFSPTGSIAGATVTAISGLDIAIHDLAGKLLDVPAYQLLGGKYRDEIRVYVDCHAGAHAGSTDEADDVYSPEAYADAAERVVEEGFDGLKFDLDATTRYERDEHNRHLNAEAVDYKRRLVEAVTKRVGPETDVAFDCHWNYTGDSARRLAEAIEDYDVWWLEDVIPPENLDVQREITHATNTPICTGENLYRTHGTRPLIEEQGVDIIQPDMPKYGGMRETVKLAHQADDYYIPLALHNVSTPLGTMAGAHVGTACPNFLTIEWHSRDDPNWDKYIKEDSIIEDGTIDVPDRPGLGVTLDLDFVEQQMAGGETLLDEE